MAIAALKTDISALEELLTEKSTTMNTLKTQADSLIRKGKGEDKIFSFANRTRSALQCPTQLQNWLRLVSAVYEWPKPAGTYYLSTHLIYLLQTHLMSSLEQKDSEEPRTELDSHVYSRVIGSY